VSSSSYKNLLAFRPVVVTATVELVEVAFTGVVELVEVTVEFDVVPVLEEVESPPVVVVVVVPLPPVFVSSDVSSFSLGPLTVLTSVSSSAF
jgi:hypothetical protein